MSRYHSPYAASAVARRPARWPWLLVFLLAAVMAAATGIVLGRGDTADRLLGAAGLLDHRPTATRQAAAQLTTPTPTATAEPDVEPTSTGTAGARTLRSDESAPATGDEPAAASVGERSELRSDPAADPDEEAPVTDQPSPAEPTVAAMLGEDPATEATDLGGSPTDTVRVWAERWSAGDYDGLFELLTNEARLTLARTAYLNQHEDELGFDRLSAEEQTELARDAFVGRYRAIRDEAGLIEVKVTEIGEPNLDTAVPIHVVMESSKVGTIEEDNVVQLRREDGVWKVAWTPSLIFKDLGDGCISFSADPVRRGSILDRDGEPLAYDGIVNEIGIIPGQLENETATLRELSKLIDMSVADIRALYKDAPPDWFIPIKTLPDPLEQRILNGISQMQGVAIREKTARVYPLGPAAAHITGYVQRVTAEDLAADTDGVLSPNDVIGRAGIEAAANDLLTGQPGGRLRVVECRSRAERTVIATRRPIPPKDLILTIDADFQRAVDAALGDVRGSAVVLDPRTGAVLALASRPSFDPNWFVTGLSEKDAKYVFSERRRPLLNRAAQAAYPTGSIFKVITMAAAMEHLGYTADSEIYCPVEWSIPGTDVVFRDWTYEYGVGPQGLLTLHTALVNSCNTVFYQLGYELDKQGEHLLPEMTKAFGLGAPTGIPYLPEIAGTVPSPEWKLEVFNDYWARGDAVNLAIGQGYLEATPLQMANAYAAIANGGALLQPFIVEYTREPDGTTTRVGKRTVIHRLPVSRANLRAIQRALRDQTSNSWGAGSVSVFGDFGWPIAGKTGTAQNQLNKAEKPHSWFAAFGPYGERATIVSIVMVESSGEGVAFAAPRTREIYEAYLRSDFVKPADS